MSEVVDAGLQPFFDRLSGTGESGGHLPLLDFAGVQSSIARELQRLLNTRSRLTMAQFLESSDGVLDYGLPDLTTLTGQSEADLERVSRLVARAIDYFEPRLSEVEVAVVSAPLAGQTPRVVVSGAVRLGRHRRRVDFDLGLESSAETDSGSAGRVMGVSAAPWTP